MGLLCKALCIKNNDLGMGREFLSHLLLAYPHFQAWVTYIKIQKVRRHWSENHLSGQGLNS